MEKTLKPSLRFKGFTEAWEQCKLGQLISQGGSGGTPTSTNPSYYNGNIPFLSITDITNSNGYIYSTEKNITELGLKNSAAWLVPKEAISLAMYASVGKVAILKENVATSQAFYNLVINNLSTRDYVYHFLKKMDMNKAWDSLISTGTQANLNAEKVKNLKIPIPSKIDEQLKLGILFNNIDSLITLHQRKYDKLVNVKKALLDKMFPKNGELVPKLRFKGFTDTWEQCELLEVAKYRNGKAHENEIDETGMYIVVNSKFVSTDGKVKKYTNNLIEPLFKNEVAFVLSDVPNGKAIARTYLVNESNKYSLNQRIAGITPLEFTHPYFLSILMNRNKYFLSFDDGAKQTNLSKDDVEQFESFYPKYQEQLKIGCLFENIDDLITLHQRKYEKLVNIKKALLQKMFV